MPIGRLWGPTKVRFAGSETTWPSISIRPPVARSSPAIIRRVVVFPQPLGPSSVTSLPSGISRSMPSTALWLTCRPG